MDQNQFPSSSPIQSHHNDFTRPARQEANVAQAGNTTRPASSHTSHSSSSQTGIRRSTDGASGGEGVVQWSTAPARKDSWDESANAEAGPSTQPLASTSRLPTEASYPSPSLPSAPLPPPSLVVPTYPYASMGSPLLTSEPLNRSSSSQTSPVDAPPVHVLPAPPARPTKRRLRASSLPSADPIYKRRRCGSGAWPTPSETIARSYAGRTRELSVTSANRARARALGERLLAGRPLRGGCRPGDQIIIAARHPPINIKTLKALDASEILKNPQLRHDLLFDTLAFRPVNVGTGSHSSCTSGELVPAASDSEVVEFEPREGCAVTDMYWESIAAEILDGCRCTRWQVSASATLDSHGIKGKTRMDDCICGKWRHDMSEDDWLKFQKTRGWSSRLPDLITTLREILVSLMGSTTPCLNHFAHSYTREALDLHELTCPTVTHALVPQLYEALDPDFITRRVRRRAFDMNIFTMLGEAMKVHCAPIRDSMVDDMVNTAMGINGKVGDVALGLRKCFDCVEVMKLDIANHQVHALRPHLWTSAMQDELSAFRGFVAAANLTTETSLTREWIRNSSMRVLTAAQPQYRKHLIGQCPCSSKAEFILRSVGDGFVKLIFSDRPGGGQWPPVCQRRITTVGMVVKEEEGEPVMPEGLRMDASRIKGFYAEAAEVAIIHLLILACRDMLVQIRPKASPAAIKADLAVLSAELESIASTMPLIPVKTAGYHSDIAIRLSGRMLEAAANDGMPKEEAYRIGAEMDVLAYTLDCYMEEYVNPDSLLVKISLERIDEAMRVLLPNNLLRLRFEDGLSQLVTGCCAPNPVQAATAASAKTTSSTPEQAHAVAQSRNASAALQLRQEAAQKQLTTAEDRVLRRLGLDTVETELRDLVKRVEKIAGFHAAVYSDLYSGRGMMVGS